MSRTNGVLALVRRGMVAPALLLTLCVAPSGCWDVPVPAQVMGVARRLTVTARMLIAPRRSDGGDFGMDGTFDPGGEQATGCKIGTEVRRLRTGQKVSLSGLAHQVHYTKGYLSKIENGKKRLTPELARVLDEALQTGGVLAGLLPSPECRTPGDDDPDLADTQVCPYPGLVAFGPPEAQWFFGRDQATREVIGRLGDRLAGGGPLVVVAPSGAGKSSLLAAGVVPALAGGALPGSRDWPVVVTTPGAHPLTTLAARIAERTGANPAVGAAISVDPERFAVFLTNTVAVQGGNQGEAPSSARIVLIVDQFEETFTECQQEAERHAFITALCAAAHTTAALVVLGVRADFYGHCLTYPALLSALRDPVALGPINPEQLRSIITGPAETEGLQVEPGLVELLLRDLGVTEDPGAQRSGYDPGALPLLAHALRVSCLHRSGRLLTVAGYQRTGGIRGAIATTAERAYTRLSPFEQQVAQQLLLRMVQVDTHIEALRRRVSRERLLQALPAPTEATEKVLETFARARLLTCDTDSVEITHEALLRAWPRLADWISADRAGLRVHQQLSEAAESWEADDRDPSLLYRGSRLATAHEWATSPGHPDQLSTLEQAYLQASINQKRHDQHAERRRARRLHALVGVLATSLVIAVLAVDFAFQQSRLAKATELVARSYSMAATHPDVEMLLAVEAYHRASIPITQGALLSAQSQYLAGQLTGHTGSITKVVFSPDGHTLATASTDHTVRFWDVASHHQIAKLDSPGLINDAEFSPNGHTLATVNYDGTVRLWDVTDPRHPRKLTPLPSVPDAIFSAVTFSHDGSILATIGADGTARLWDMARRHPIATLAGHTDPITKVPDGITKVVFSLDGHTLATVNEDRTARLWNVATPTQPTPLGPPLTGHTGPVEAVAFSPDGHTLATANDDGTARLWDINNPRQPHPVSTLTGHTGSVKAVVFSPDGHTLATASTDKTAKLWDVATHQTIGTLRGHSGPNSSVAFNQDGRTVATAGEDRIVRLWNVGGPILTPAVGNDEREVTFSPDGRLLATVGTDGVRLWDRDAVSRLPIATLPGTINTAAFGEDGRLLATASADGVRLWDLNNHHIATLPGHASDQTSLVTKMVFSPKNPILATTSIDGTARLWNVADPTRPTPLDPPLTGHLGPVEAVAFSHDGHTLATASDDGTARLWDSVSRRPIATLTVHTGSLITAVVFSPDDRILTTASNDGTVQKWQTDTGRRLNTAWTIIPLLLPGERFSPMAFSPDGRTLATTSSDDTTTSLWDVDKQQLSATLTGHTDLINAAAFSQDGSFLATVSNDGTTRLWDLDPDRVMSRLCHIIGTFDRGRWKRFLPDLPYQTTCP